MICDFSSDSGHILYFTYLLLNIFDVAADLTTVRSCCDMDDAIRCTIFNSFPVKLTDILLNGLLCKEDILRDPRHRFDILFFSFFFWIFAV